MIAGQVESAVVNNIGTIAGGVDLFGTLTNSGVISGASGIRYGASVAMSIVNQGTIIANSSYRVRLPSNSTLVNSGRIIAGGGVGVSLQSGDTLVNSGTIGGLGTAVSFSSRGELLVIEPGDTFTNALSGFGEFDTIDLAGVKADHAVFNGNTLGGNLTVLNGTATVETLRLAGRFTTNSFIDPPARLPPARLAGGRLAGREQA